MSSLEAFRASLSVTPGDEEARRMTATSGRQCIAPSMKSSPLGLWLRTLLESSRWSSRARFLRWQVQPLFSTRLTTFEDDTSCERPLPCNASAQTLKVTDMPSSRCLFRLVPSEPPTDETGCSSSQGEKKNLLLPTPLVVEREHPDRVENLKAAGATRINSRVNGEQRPNGLIDFMQFYDMLPTPRANQVNGCDLDNPKLAERNKSNLEEEVAKAVVNGLLPTRQPSRV